jgi:peptide/nickel transport system ATP-binding protein
MTSLLPPGDTDPFVLEDQIHEERAEENTRDVESERPERLWRRFVRDRFAVAGLAYLIVITVLAILAPWVAPYKPNIGNLTLINAGPSGAHWLGTDDLGRDILSRLIWGARVSFRATFQIVGMAIVVALPIGLIAGYFRGWFDTLVMRLMDALFAFPPLVLALSVAALLGANLNDASIAIAVVFVPSFVRLIRGEVIAVREETYVESSQSLGVGPSRLIRSHIFPNVSSPIVIQVALALGFALLAEAGLSFLGLGAQPPTPSWGNMLSEAYNFIFADPTALIWPGLAITITVLAFNLAADGLRDALGRERTVSVKRARQLGRWMRGRLRGSRSAAATVNPTEGATDADAAADAAGADAVIAATAAVTPAASAPSSAAGPTSLLAVDRIRVEFNVKGEWLPVVEDVSFDVKPGQTIGLVGESGSGKTVSALAVMGLLPPGGRLAAGHVGFNGRELTTMAAGELRKLRGAEISMIFQEPMTSLNPAYSVGNQIAEQVRVHKGVSRKEAWNVAVEMLDKVEIPNAAKRAREYPHLFSGGMRQRVMIAMALSCQPKLLIADEPTTALDVTTQAQIVDLLRSLLEEHSMSMIFVTHDLGVIADVADEVVVMYAGQIVEQSPVDGLFGRPRHPYTEALLASMPQMTPAGMPLHAIPGRVPRPDEVSESCRFCDRCEYAEDRCREQPVLLLPTRSDGRSDTQQLARCLRQEELHLWRGGTTRQLAAGVGAGPEAPPEAANNGATAGSEANALEVSGLSKLFPIRSGVLRRVTGSVNAVDNVTLSIPTGSTLGLVGESGSGKSTLARLVMRLIDPTAGSVRIDGTEVTTLTGSALRERRDLMQMVFQDPYSSLDPRHTIADTVGEPLVVHSEMGSAERTDRVVELLGQVGMNPSALERYPHQFSGGQRQRVAIARALAVHPRLLVCDEAVSSLDVSTQAQVINLLRDLQAELGTAYLFIAHDLSVVRHISDRIAVMYLGQVVEEGPAEEVYARPTHPYTAALLSAIPVPDPTVREQHRRVVLRGEVGDATSESIGCRFRARCAYAMDVCKTVDPEPHHTPVGVSVRCHLHTEGPTLAGETVLSLPDPASIPT